MWRERIAELTTEVAFSAGVAAVDLDRANEMLGGPLPDLLVELLLETDGVRGEHGQGLVWPLARIVGDNLHFRESLDFAELYMPFDPLLFFADAGNGDQFAFVSKPRRDDVFVWDHESDSRTWAAGSLEQYLQWRLDGTLKI